MIQEGKKIFLCSPSGKCITMLNGIDITTVSYTEKLKGYDILELRVDRYITVSENGLEFQVESDGYQHLKYKMRLYLDGVGYFEMQEPSVENDGWRESKFLTCYSLEKKLYDKDVVGLKINCGTNDSREYLAEGNLDELGFPKKYVCFCDEKKPDLSLMHIIVNEYATDWKIGYVSPLLKPKKLKLDIDNQNVYYFLTATVAPKFECLFTFDTVLRRINVYDKDELGKNTNIFIGLRNLINKVNVETKEDSVFTCYNVRGDDDLDIADVNFGQKKILNLDYFMTEPFVAPSTIEKFKIWKDYREGKRPQYIDLSKQWVDLADKIAEIENRVPNDGCDWKQWDNMEEDLLQKNLAYYKKLLQSLQMSVDPDDPQYSNPRYSYDADGDFASYEPWTNSKKEVDHERYLNLLQAQANGYGGYYTYMQVLDYVIPNIEIAIENLGVVQGDKKYYVKEFETNWELCGIKLLEGQLEKYENDIKGVLKQYVKPWEELTAEERAAQNGNEETYKIQHGKYLEHVGHIGSETTPGSLKYKLKQLKSEVEVLTNQQNEIQAKRTAMIEDVDIKNRKWFTEREYRDLDSVIVEKDYVNNNIITTSTDTTLTKIDVQETLYEVATEKLIEDSRPKYTFSVDIDNLMLLEPFSSWKKDFKSGNFLYLGIRDDYAVELRLVSRKWNPCDLDPQIVVEFSSMTTTKNGLNDFYDIFNTENNQGAKNVISIGNGNAKDDLQLSTDILNLLMGNKGFGTAINDLVGIDIDDGRVVNLVSDYMKTVRLDAEKITAKDAFFQSMVSEYIKSDIVVSDKSVTDLLMAGGIITGDVSSATGHFTDYLTGVKIIGDLIEAHTLIADKLILRGDDKSLVYALNELGELTQEQLTPEEVVKYQIDGKILVADSITSKQIHVKDLWVNGVANFLNTNVEGTAFINNLVNVSARIGNWDISYDHILGGVDSYIRGGILESPNFRIDANGNVTSGCQVDLNNGIVSARNFVINANNFTLDKNGNATYKGMVNADQLTIGLNPNLMPNGLDTFEQYTEVPCISKSTQLPVSIDNTVHYYGSRSLKLGKNSYVGVSVVLGESVAKDGIKVKSNKKYRISCYTKHDGTSEKTIRLMAVGYKTDFTSMDYIKQPFSVKEGEDWKRISFVYTASPEYPYLTIGIELRNSQINAWFDAFQVEEVENDSQEPGAFKPAGTTFINGNNVTTGIIASSNGKFKIDLDNELITAENLALDSDYLQITKDGKLTCTSGIFTGEVNATSGNIAGWNINENGLYNGCTSMTSTVPGTFIGTDGIRQYKSGEQYVDIRDGKITATGANMSGKVKATEITAKDTFKMYTSFDGTDRDILNMTYAGDDRSVPVLEIGNNVDGVNINNGTYINGNLNVVRRMDTNGNPFGGDVIVGGELDVQGKILPLNFKDGLLTVTSISDCFYKSSIVQTNACGMKFRIELLTTTDIAPGGHVSGGLIFKDHSNKQMKFSGNITFIAYNGPAALVGHCSDTAFYGTVIGATLPSNTSFGIHGHVWLE